MKVNLILRKKVCAQCNTEYNSQALSEFAYGEFLVYSKKNNLLYYLEVNDRCAFDELSSIIKSLPKEQLPKTKNYLTQELVYLICDPAKDGSTLHMFNVQKCPTCHSTEVKTWWQVKPIQTALVDLPLVTFKNWEKLSDKEKKEKVTAELEKF